MNEHFLNLVNNFPEREESQTRHKEPTTKNIWTEDMQYNNKMIEILRYMKPETASLKKKQEALEALRSPRLLDLSNNDIESECLISEHTSRIETSPEKQSYIDKSKSGKCGSSILLNPVTENHKLPVKQT